MNLKILTDQTDRTERCREWCNFQYHWEYDPDSRTWNVCSISKLLSTNVFVLKSGSFAAIRKNTHTNCLQFCSFPQILLRICRYCFVVSNPWNVLLVSNNIHSSSVSSMEVENVVHLVPVHCLTRNLVVHYDENKKLKHEILHIHILLLNRKWVLAIRIII